MQIVPAMMNHEFYRKYKTRYPVDKFFQLGWWQITLIIVGVALLEPLIVYKKLGHIPFTRSYYFQQIEYFVLLSAPFFLLYIWTTWKESVKRNRGYCWVGKFEVIRKESSFIFCHLLLTPGKESKLRVSRSFFNKVNRGDIVMIRRDALGKIESVVQVKDFRARIKRLTIRIEH